jgi:hypothetical protein
MRRDQDVCPPGGDFCARLHVARGLLSGGRFHV